MVGVNEYYTSKKCPVCQDFVAQVEIRRLYCPKCKSYMHRDIMAGHNICNAVRGHLLEQTRPLYLQPIDQDGKYPWMESTSSSSSSSSGGGSGGNGTGNGAGNDNSSSTGHGKGRANSRKRPAPSDDSTPHSNKRVASSDKSHPSGPKRKAAMVKSRL